MNSAGIPALTGESVWRGFVRLQPVFAFLLWLLMIVSFLWFGAFATAGGTALTELVPWPVGWTSKERSLMWAAATLVVCAFALLTQKRTYALIEKVMWVVAVVTLAGLVVSALSAPVRGSWPSFLKALIVPPPLARPWEAQDADPFLTALTFVGLGGFWTLFYSYWVLAKGVACAGVPGQTACVPREPAATLAVEGRKWNRALLFDAGAGIAGNLVTTLLTCFLAYAILFPQGIYPEKWRLAAEQSRFFQVSWGELGRCLFLFVAAAFLCDTWLSTADAVARVNLEMIRKYFFHDAQWNERTAYRTMILVLTVVTGVTMFFDQPGQLILWSAVTGFAGTVIFTVALIVLVHGRLARSLPAVLKPGRLSLGSLSVAALAYAVLAVCYLKVKFF